MKWSYRTPVDAASTVSTEVLIREFGIAQWLAQILQSRLVNNEIKTLEEAKVFLDPTLKFLPDPFSLPDMDQAAERLSHAIVEGEKIALFADYDVDGTVGASILRRFLRAFGVEPIIYQPDRQLEGYGINKSAVQKLADQGVNLFIAIDCGITAVAEVDLANELGMNVIICDHHEPKEILPAAYAVLDHKRIDNESPIKNLSGAGVAFYLAMAVRSVLRDAGYFEEREMPEPDLRDYLDLVALAAVADLVPLVGENRILVKAGLDKMRRKPTLGIRELFAQAKVNLPDVSTYHLGFLLGPRINAAGRMGSANAALELLTTDSAGQATEIASRLESVNRERVNVQAEVAEEALVLAEKQFRAQPDLPAFVLAGEDWHEGIIGIVASRVVEKYHRPTVIITFGTHNGNGKGSVRGISRLDMLAALEKSAENLLGFGGHKMAAGLSLKKENLEAFQKDFLHAIESQFEAIRAQDPNVRFEKEILLDAYISSDEEVTAEHISFLEKLGPFGMGNPEPVLSVGGWKISGTKTMKERHLKLQLQSESKKSLEGFWANGVEKNFAQTDGLVEVCGMPVINNFMNLRRLEWKIKDVREIQ